MMFMSRMSVRNKIFLALVFVILILLGLLYYFYVGSQEIKSIDSFEKCAKKYAVAESYPRQCWTPDGKHFVESISEYGNITWRNDGISLARVKGTGEYACFGCNERLCVDPLLDAIEFVDETENLRCTGDFEVVKNELPEYCPDAWYDNQQPCVCLENDCSNCEGEKEYFIVDGQRRELSEFDVPWIQENCEVRKQAVY